MIKAHEIRIGNYVGHSILGGNNIVTEIYQKAVHLNGKIRTLIEYIEPIPLTPELLEKVGFVKINSTWYGLNDFCVNIAGNSEYKGIMVNANIQYLHQLQNTYYFLEGKELAINL